MLIALSITAGAGSALFFALGSLEIGLILAMVSGAVAMGFDGR